LRPDRRAFLRVGAGCALPLMAGVILESRGIAASGASAASAEKPVGQNSTDSVLAHAQQELARTYHAMRGPAGIRGEHVRSLAANLELIGVCLRSRNDDARVDAALRRRIQEKGREAATDECLAAYDELAVEIELQYGVVSRGGHDRSRAAAALDSVAARGVASTVRAHKAVLNRLAAAIDRAEVIRGARAKPLAVRQKPGDDFLGYPPGSVLDGLTLCQQLEALQFAIELTAAFLALVSGGSAAAALALCAIILDLIKLLPCKQDVAL
jgi:hypothetical protein